MLLEMMMKMTKMTTTTSTKIGEQSVIKLSFHATISFSYSFQLTLTNTAHTHVSSKLPANVLFGI